MNLFWFSQIFTPLGALFPRGVISKVRLHREGAKVRLEYGWSRVTQICIDIFDMIRKTYQVLEYREYSLRLQIQITHLGTKHVFPTFLPPKPLIQKKAHSLF